MAEEGDIRVFNPNKEISREITLDILIRHRNAMKQARTGEIEGLELTKSANQRKINQVRALNLIISAQREMITISRPIVYFRALQKWKKKHKTKEAEDEEPFDQDENDYKDIKEWADFLAGCEQAIITAERTQSLEDDFLVTKDGQEGPVHQLTTNFYEMITDLESAYEKIYLLMLTNKIVSAGIEEDEELTYKQKEEEAIRRVVEA